MYGRGSLVSGLQSGYAFFSERWIRIRIKMQIQKLRKIEQWRAVDACKGGGKNRALPGGFMTCGRRFPSL
jgi:hypothetical protein